MAACHAHRPTATTGPCYVNGGLTAHVTGTGAGMTSAWTWLVVGGDLGTSGGSSLSSLTHVRTSRTPTPRCTRAVLPAWRVLAHYCAADHRVRAASRPAIRRPLPGHLGQPDERQHVLPHPRRHRGAGKLRDHREPVQRHPVEVHLLRPGRRASRVVHVRAVRAGRRRRHRAGVIPVRVRVRGVGVLDRSSSLVRRLHRVGGGRGDERRRRSPASGDSFTSRVRVRGVWPRRLPTFPAAPGRAPPRRRPRWVTR